jgi:hypothetical protein
MKNPNVLAQKKRERKSSETELISWTDSRLDGSLIIRHLHLSQFHQWTETAKIRWPQQSSDRSKNAIKSSTNEDKSIWEVWKLFSSKQVGFYNWAKKKPQKPGQIINQVLKLGMSYGTCNTLGFLIGYTKIQNTKLQGQRGEQVTPIYLINKN